MKLLKIIINLLLLSSTLFSIEELPEAFKKSNIDYKLGNKVLSTVQFYDQNNNLVTLDSFLGDKPLLINFSYYSCPRLCHFLTSGLSKALLSLDIDTIKRIRILTISFDDKDSFNSLTAFKEKYLPSLISKFDDNIDWTFLRGDKENIDLLTTSVGFNFFFDYKSNQYSHPSTIIFLSSTGIVTRYINGISFKPSDIKLSIIDSIKNKSLSTVDSLLLFCYNYDPDENSYTLQARNLMKFAALLTIFILIIVFLMLNKRND